MVCRKNGYDGVLCPCGAMHLEPEPPEDAVDPTEDPHPAWFYSRSAPIKLAWLARSHPRGKLLEVGCGDGSFLEEARRRGYEVAGLDAHPERARAAQARLGERVRRALVEHVADARPDFDIVYHCDLLAHFPDPGRALTQMRAFLKPGGVLFFEVGTYGNIGRYWYERMSEESFPRHRRLLSEANLEQVLSRCGLRVLRKKRYGLAPHVLAYEAAKRVRRALRSQAKANAQLPASPPVEHRLVQYLHTFMRYRIGALTPGWGPQTVLVIAR